MFEETVPIPYRKKTAVKRARRKWKRVRESPWYKCKSSLSFEDFLRLFAKQFTFDEIARQAGIGGMAVSKIYHRYFVEIFGKESIKERKQALSDRKRPLLRSANFLRKIDTQERSVIEKALDAGCILEPVPINRPHHHDAKVSRFVLNGKLCSFHRLTNPHHLPKNLTNCYTQIRFPKKEVSEVKFVIFSIKLKRFPERIFIVPSSFIMEKVFHNHKCISRVHIPVLKDKPQRRHAIDFSEYEDAWHLLQN